MPVVQTVVAHLPLDWVVLGLFAALVAIDAMRSGAQHAAAFSLAAPLALFISGMLASSAFIGTSLASVQSIYASMGVFFGIFIFLFFAIYRMMPVGLQRGASPLRALLAGLAAAIVLAVVWLQVPGLAGLAPLSPLARAIFGPAYRLFWLVGAFLGLALARG